VHRRRDRDGEPGGSRVGLIRPSLLAVAAGTVTVLPGFLVGALALQIRGDLDASVEAVAAGVSVFFLAGAFGAGPGGRLSERTGALRAMVGSALLACVCLLAAGLAASSLLALFACLVVAGLSNAVAQPAINLFMADQVPMERQGLAFGIKQSAIPAAVFISGLALPVLAIPLGWRATFAICALAPLAVAVLLSRQAASLRPVPERERPPRPSRALILIALGAALGSSAPSALGAYLVASAVDAGIAEGTAGILAAVGSAASLAVRLGVGIRADRRLDYGFGMVVTLLALGCAGFALLAAGTPAPFAIGAVLAFALGWGWPGIFNMAVVHLHRDSPGAATGVSQTGIYVGAGGGPAAFGALYAMSGYTVAWLVTAAVALAAAFVMALAGRRVALTRP
jgi:predicted MFS family arabinose efflux permease